MKLKGKAEPAEGYVGFIAEDVPELVASLDHKTVSSMDVVAVLARVVKDHEKTIAELQKALDELKSHNRR